MDEFVESIPFTETREYVQAIIRNQEICTANWTGPARSVLQPNRISPDPSPYPFSAFRAADRRQ